MTRENLFKFISNINIDDINHAFKEMNATVFEQSNKAFLAVNLDGSEVITINKPKLKDGYWTDEVYKSFDGQGGKPVYHHSTEIELPSGTIEKILGFKLKYSDGPYKLI